MQRNNQEINIAQLLEVRKSLQDQTGLTNLERLRNLAGAFQVKSQIESDSYESRGLIVIDDVVASGSTLREAVRALKERNLTVIGAASACFTFRY
jgi:predicted amidophosphoribosyltransferase